MHSVRIELAKLILVGTRITYQATGDAAYLCEYSFTYSGALHTRYLYLVYVKHLQLVIRRTPYQV